MVAEILRDMIVASTLLVGVTAFFVRAVQSASCHSSLWEASLATMVLVPILSTILPRWPLLAGAQSELAAGVVLDPQGATGGGFGSWLWLGWLLGAVAVAVPLGLSATRLRRWLRVDIAESSPLLTRELALCARMLRMPVPRLLVCGSSMPCTVGLIRPAIVLPRDSLRWSRRRVRAVMLHELAHVGRRDHHYQVVAQLAQVLFWFQPLVWYASRRYHVEREHACDDLVLTSGMRPSGFAEELVSIARRFGVAQGLPAMCRPGELKRRVVAILDERADRRRMSAVRTGTMYVGLAVIAAVASTMVVRDQDTFHYVVELEIDPSDATLRLHSDSAQRVNIAGERRQNVLVRATLVARADDPGEAASMLSEVVIHSDPTLAAIGPTGTWWVNYEIAVPRQYDVTITGDDPDIDLRHVTGAITFDLDGGAVRLGGLGGQVQGYSRTGEIRAVLTGETWRGRGLSLRSETGPIRIAISKNYSAEVDVLSGVQTRAPLVLGRGGPRIDAYSESGTVTLAQR